MALAVAAVGTYGVMAYLVGQGTRDIGIRMALGAGRGRVLGMVFGHGAWLAAAGIGRGPGGGARAVAVPDGAAVRRQRARPADVRVDAALLLGGVAAACYVPARRAARVDPIVSLRCE